MDNTILLEKEKNEFQDEQDKLLKTVLEYRFFRPWQGNTFIGVNSTSIQDDANLELFITNKCNQNCEYCYLPHNKLLYPIECSNETILKNLDLLYSYLLKKNSYIPEIAMFSGEIWHTQLGLDVLDLTLEYINKGLGIGQVTIPSNCFFLNSSETMQKIQSRINKFNMSNCPLKFSISIDGKIIDELERPRNSKILYNDDFYDNVFAFAKHNNYCFHPMLSSSSMKYWSENYEWWKKMHQYYNLDLYKTLFLEVRNNDWTDETIQYYCDFIIKLADDFLLTKCNNNIEQFANIMTMIRNAPVITEGYVPWFIQHNDTFPSCTIGTHLTVRLGDLAICPCHRTAYDKYLYGHFVVKDDEIVDIKAQNPQMAIKVLMSNTQVTDPRCDTCIWRDCCLHGCLGAQYEYNKDPFFPVVNICKFFNAKYSCLMKYYKEKGIIDYYKNISEQELGSDLVIDILKIYKNWEESQNGLGTY